MPLGIADAKSSGSFFSFGRELPAINFTVATKTS